MKNTFPNNNIKRIHFIVSSAYLEYDTILKAKHILESNGFEITIANSCFLNNNFETTDKERINDLQLAINDPNIDAIIPVRGGYGLIRIIEKVDFSLFLKYPKWIIGYSDITILHLVLNNLKIASIHSTMCKDIADINNVSAQLLIDKLKNKFNINYKINPHKLNIEGESYAELIGGNLSIIYSLQGTPFEIDTNNKILFIEDLNEKLYHLDRMLFNLRLSGKFDNLKGLIVGQFTEFIPDSYFSDAYSIIYLHIKDYDFPCCFNFPVGHCKNNYPLVCGSNYSFNVNAEFVQLSEII